MENKFKNLKDNLINLIVESNIKDIQNTFDIKEIKECSTYVELNNGIYNSIVSNWYNIEDEILDLALKISIRLITPNINTLDHFEIYTYLYICEDIKVNKEKLAEFYKFFFINFDMQIESKESFKYYYYYKSFQRFIDQ